MLLPFPVRSAVAVPRRFLPLAGTNSRVRLRPLKASLAVTTWVALAAVGPARAQVVFDANFNTQPIGPLSIGPRPGLPQVILRDPGATANVVASAGNLADKPVVLHSAPGALVSVAFDNPSQLSSGDWRVSWDSLVFTTPANDPLIHNNVSITADNGAAGLPTILGIKYVPSGQFSVEDATGFHTVGSFSVGSSSRFDLDLHLGSGTYQLFVNNGSLLSGTLAANGQFLRTNFTSNGRTGFQLPDFAFDNFVVQSVPEPGALALGAFAMLSAAVAPRMRGTPLPSAGGATRSAVSSRRASS